MTSQRVKKDVSKYALTHFLICEHFCLNHILFIVFLCYIHIHIHILGKVPCCAFKAKVFLQYNIVKMTVYCTKQ